MSRDAYNAREDDRQREDDEYGQATARDRIDRAAEKAPWPSTRDLWQTAEDLNVLKTEFCNTGPQRRPDKTAENREWMGAQFAKRGIDYEDARAVAYGTSLPQAESVVAELIERGDMSRQDLESFLALSFANTWIDAALTLAVYMGGKS